MNITQVIERSHCQRKSVLSANNPEISLSPEIIQFNDLKKQFYSSFTHSVSVDKDHSTDNQIETRRVMECANVKAVINAQFATNVLTDKVDVLQRINQGWDLYVFGISLNTKSDDIKKAVAQYYIATTGGNVIINDIYHVHPNRDFVCGNNDNPVFFTKNNITDEVHDHLPEFIRSLNFKNIYSPNELGSQCKKPSQCPHYDTCLSKTGAKYPIENMPNFHKRIGALKDKGIIDITDISLDDVKSAMHKRVISTTQSGQAYFDKSIYDVLNELGTQYSFLDFETIQLVYPIWKGCKSYTQVPFQASILNQLDTNKFEQFDVLITNGDDPRRKLAKTLADKIPATGAVIVYNQAFEKRILKALAADFPEYATKLKSIISRLYDLLPVVKAHYYHPDQKGSWSLKSIVEVLLPEVSYKRLPIQNGRESQIVYLELLNKIITDPVEVHNARNNLLYYCRADTANMLHIINKLRNPDKQVNDIFIYHDGVIN